MESIKKYLDRERVVAIGEIGYDLITDLEEEVFVKQMDIAAKKNMLITIHLPHHNKLEGIKRIENILLNNINNNKYNRNKILVNHNVEETIEKTLELGMWAGLSVYPVTKLSPKRAINIIKKYGTDRIMVHFNSSINNDICTVTNSYFLYIGNNDINRYAVAHPTTQNPFPNNTETLEELDKLLGNNIAIILSDTHISNPKNTLLDSININIKEDCMKLPNIEHLYCP
jgi:predicted metal-dependent TIM-barrel fold hydrolase